MTDTFSDTPGKKITRKAPSYKDFHEMQSPAALNKSTILLSLYTSYIGPHLSSNALHEKPGGRLPARVGGLFIGDRNNCCKIYR